MGSFLLTNSRIKAENGIKRLENAGFFNFNEISTDDYFLRVNKKRNIANENFLMFDNGDFIAINGTCILNDKIGNSMLVDTYHNFNGCMDDIRKKLIGHYVIIIKKGDVIHIACDKHELFRVYYCIDDDFYVFSTSFEAIVATLKRKIINKFRLYQILFHGSMIGTETLYKGVRRLLGNDEFILDTASEKIHQNQINNNRIKYNFKEKSMRQCVEFYTQDIKSVFLSISKVFNRNISIEMTGGMDTRTVFAALNNVGGYSDFSYGLSGSPLVGQLHGDLQTIKQLAKKYQRKIHLMNWENDGSIDESTFEEYFKKYGFDYVTYGCSRNYFQEYEKRIIHSPNLLMNGYFGETIKGREWLNYRWENPISLSKVIYKCFIYNWINDNLIRNSKEWKEFKLFFESQFIEQAKINYNLKIENRKVYKNDFDELRWMADRYGDSIVTNLYNQFTYCLSPLGDTRLFDKALEIPYKYRKHNIFQFELIKSLDSTLIDIPLFTHCHFRKIKDGILLKEKLSFQQLISHYFTRTYRELYLYRKRSRQKNNHMIQEYKRYIIKNSFLDEYLNVEKTFDPITLSYIVLYTFGINKLGMDSLE